MAEKILVKGLRAAIIKINGHWGAVEIYLDTEKNKLVAVEQGDKCEGVYLSTFNAQRFNARHHYTMREVESYLTTGLQAHGYGQYVIQ